MTYSYIFPFVTNFDRPFEWPSHVCESTEFELYPLCNRAHDLFYFKRSLIWYNVHCKDGKRLYLNSKELKCMWSTKSITFHHMVRKSVGFCWEMIVFRSMQCLNEDLQAQSKSYNNTCIIVSTWCSSIQAVLLWNAVG